MDVVGGPESGRVTVVSCDQLGDVVVEALLVWNGVTEQLAGGGYNPRKVVVDPGAGRTRDAVPVLPVGSGTSAANCEKHGYCRVSGTTDRNGTWLTPAAARDRQPWRANGERGHPEPGVRGHEHAAPLDDGELFQQRTIEGISRDDAVLAQPIELRAIERRRRLLVAL